MDMNKSWTAQQWMNRGAELLDPDPRLAQRLISRGLQLEPEEAVGWFNLGIGLHQQRRIEAAVRAYQHCLALPHDKETEKSARNNLAQDLLLLGAWQQGWHYYAFRFHRKPGNHPIFAGAFGPSHQGTLHPERPLLLMSEQGFGDTIQFSRYALFLQQKGFDVTILSQPALVPLLKEAVSLTNVVDKIDIKDWKKRYPSWMPLLDVLPSMQSQQLWTPYSESYLKIQPERINTWEQKLKRKPGKQLIALHWQGNPGHEHTLYSRGRSLPFERLLALRCLDNVEFVSIQKGAGSEKLRLNQGLTFVKGQAQVSQSMDFLDTAAILSNCDLLISSDSAVVHLAGAMGIPTWLALRWIPEWRWGLEGERTAWYDSVRLFRQQSDGDWESVLQEMIAAWMQTFASRTKLK